MNAAPSPAPPLSLFAQAEVEVGELLSLGAAPAGERRCVAITGGRVWGDGVSGEILPGGADWQWLRSDGVLEISAHYLLRTEDGALVEVRSEGLRHGPPEVMARLARGEPVAAEEVFFRTFVRLACGHPRWFWLNRQMLLANGRREPRRVLLDFWQVN